MNLLLRYLAIVFLLAPVPHVCARPKVGLVSNEWVKYPDLGVTLFVPADTTLLGQLERDAVNYQWPWLRTMHGDIDVATEKNPKGTSLKEMAMAHLSNSRVNWKITEFDEVKINGIPAVRVAIHEEAERKPGQRRRPPYPIIRYYFLTDSEMLAYFHLHGWRDRAELEGIVKTMKKLE